jgi:hypothetical protein
MLIDDEEDSIQFCDDEGRVELSDDFHLFEMSLLDDLMDVR